MVQRNRRTLVLAGRVLWGSSGDIRARAVLLLGRNQT